MKGHQIELPLTIDFVNLMNLYKMWHFEEELRYDTSQEVPEDFQNIYKNRYTDRHMMRGWTQNGHRFGYID